ncbi:MAG: hypothetical protein IT249_07300 [Chitinophagaceae bacterium]|nr:hypothetical protein [Chitinophagaceae bacterium]
MFIFLVDIYFLEGIVYYHYNYVETMRVNTSKKALKTALTRLNFCTFAGYFFDKKTVDFSEDL